MTTQLSQFLKTDNYVNDEVCKFNKVIRVFFVLLQS